MEGQFVLLPAGSGSSLCPVSAHMRLINHRNHNKKVTRVLPGTGVAPVMVIKVEPDELAANGGAVLES